MNIPIKFRAVDIDTGEYVYAKLGEVSAEINPNYLTFITDEGIFTVRGETLVQLAGYDVDGKELYECDTVVDNHGDEGTVYLRGVADGETEFTFLDDESDPLTFKLKEERND